MLLVLLVCHLVVTIANPLNKYPFVFLLDVGNEELEKTNTEQIRVSIPGGSLAVRYPAVGDGNFITRVRVSGIDYGTDLKANIIDGGPGYKYVVLVFFGNTGVPYEAVATLQTQTTDMDLENASNSNVLAKSEEYDENDSAEETDDDISEAAAPNNVNDQPQPQANKKIIDHEQEDLKNGEELQSSENVYNYAEEEIDDHNSDSINMQDSYSDSDDDVDGTVDQNNIVRKENQYRAEKLQSRSDDKYVYYNKYKGNILNKNEDGLDQDARMYRQDTLNDNSYSAEDPVELDQMFNDEEVHNDAEKFRDSNNNNFDADYDSAVAY